MIDFLSSLMNSNLLIFLGMLVFGILVLIGGIIMVVKKSCVVLPDSEYIGKIQHDPYIEKGDQAKRRGFSQIIFGMMITAISVLLILAEFAW